MTLTDRSCASEMVIGIARAPGGPVTVVLKENVLSPGERREVVFPADADLLLHRLAGLNLARAERVTFTMRAESSGEMLGAMDSAPFEREEGAVLIPCQRHYAAFPHDTVAEVRIHEPDAERVVTYTILHRFA